MHFALTDEEEMIREAARRIAADRLAPLAARLDLGEGRAELLDNLKALAANGFMALNVAAEYGGTEAGTVAFALAIEELGYACAATAVAVSVTNMVGEVDPGGRVRRRRSARHLPRLADGTYPAGAFCLTESGAGSDPSAHDDARPPRRRRLLIDGEKIYITSAEFAGLFVVWAVTDPDAPKGKGISCFLVERDTPGLVDRQGRKEDGPARLADQCRALRRLPRAGGRPDGPRERRLPDRGRRTRRRAHRRRRALARDRPRRHGRRQGLCQGAPAVRAGRSPTSRASSG